ncbi:MAG TPA: hypothetical protein DG754_05100 [Bacteroidales bacterium]|jgi:hypothetical protein|nr:hypothetical protein [Bacteroidales bacterium]
MQNRYVGDIGDFTKYFLLKQLALSGLKVGVNWYFVEPTNKELKSNSGDGKHTDYLIADKYNIRSADPALFDKLRTLVVKGNRDINSIAEFGVLPHINNFYAEPIALNIARDSWFKNSLASLKACDVVFNDPDNGIIPKSVSPVSSNAKKYLLLDELQELYSTAKKTVVIYQHTARTGKVEQQILSKISEVEELLSIQNKNLVQVLYTGLGTSRFYIVVKQPSHSAQIDSSLNSILEKCTGLRLLGLFNRNSNEIEL